MYQETGIRLWRWANAISCLGVLQFLVLITLATHQYTGGTQWDKTRVGYSYTENYLSDLGREISWSGVPNEKAAGLFKCSVIVLGFSLMPFFLFLPTHAPDKSLVLWIAAVFGIVSAFALVGIGLTPYDSHFESHQTALGLWVFFLLATVTLHTWALLASKETSDLFALASFALGMLIIAYTVHGMSGTTLFGRISVPALQKCVVLGAVCWYLIFGVRMICTKELLRLEEDVSLHESAERYLKQLGRYRR